MRLSQCLPILPLCLMANTVPCANASGGRCIRVWELMRACLGAETDASGSRGADRNRERGAKHSRLLGGQSEGRIMQRSSRRQHHCVLREISVLFHFSQDELQCFAFFGSLENSSVRPYLYAKSVSNVKIILTAYLLFVNLQAILWKVMVGECFPLAGRSRFPPHRKAETARIGASLTAPL